MLKFGEQIPLLACKEVKKIQKVDEYRENMEDASNINSFGLWSWAVNGYLNRMKIKKNNKPTTTTKHKDTHPQIHSIKQ